MVKNVKTYFFAFWLGMYFAGGLPLCFGHLGSTCVNLIMEIKIAKKNIQPPEIYHIQSIQPLPQL